MRTFGRLFGALVCLVIAGALLALPAGADHDRAGPSARSATRALVHGRDGGSSQARPTSFDLFSQGGRAAVGPAVGPSARATRVPSSAFGFDALADLDGAIPSDTTGALGSQFFVTATNVRVAVYDRSGAELVAPTPLDTLHPDSVGRFVFDPKVVYDQYTDTFVLIYLVQEDSPRVSRIHVVSIPGATANDTTTWCATGFAGDLVPGKPRLWADYPSLGYTADRVTIGTNQFTFPSSQGRFKYAQILSMPKSSLYDCTQEAPTPDVFAGTQTRDPDGIQAFTIQPAQTVGEAAGRQFMLSVQLAGRRSYLTVWRLGSTATGLKLKRANVGIGRTKFPPLGTQGGGSLTDRDTFWDAGDDRLISAFYDSDRRALYAAHAVLANFKPDAVTGGYVESAVRWYEVLPANKLKSSAVARKGRIGAPGVDVGWPSVATDGSGNLFVTYNRAGQPADEFLSAWVAEIPPGTTTATQLLLSSGIATYDAVNGPERWGDFTAINRDPTAPGTMATFNQYAISTTSWQQVVNLVTHI